MKTKYKLSDEEIIIEIKDQFGNTQLVIFVTPRRGRAG
jgi:hypothetical protein